MPKYPKFLSKALRDEPLPSRSTLLARLREAGFACERTRFNRLYANTKAEV